MAHTTTVPRWSSLGWQDGEHASKEIRQWFQVQTVSTTTSQQGCYTYSCVIISLHLTINVLLYHFLSTLCQQLSTSNCFCYLTFCSYDCGLYVYAYMKATVQDEVPEGKSMTAYRAKLCAKILLEGEKLDIQWRIPTLLYYTSEWHNSQTPTKEAQQQETEDEAIAHAGEGGRREPPENAIDSKF